MGASSAFAQIATGEDDILNRLKGRSYAPNAVLVAFHSWVGQSAAESILRSGGFKVDPQVNSPYFVRLIVPSTTRGRVAVSVIDTIQILRLNPAIRVAEPDMQITPDDIPNDASFGQQWGMHNTGQSGGTVDADVDAVEAWDQTGSAPQVVVAVCDDGVDINHPDLAANIYVNPNEIPGNGIDDDSNGFIDDVRGWDFVQNDNNVVPPSGSSHGTHVAGTVSAVRNNGIGVAGFGNHVKIMPIRHYNGQSSWMSALINGIDYAWANGASVISVSYNIDGYTTLLVEAIQRAGAADVAYVNSAGNNSQNNPPRQNIRDVAPNSIFVASTTRTDARSSFSNYGTKVEIGAPGSDIYSTLPNNSYGNNSGTSMATPHAAGALGVIRAMNPQLNVRQALDVMIQTADPRPALQINGGRLNLNNAIEIDNTAPAPVANLVVNKRAATALQLSFNASGDDGNTGSASSYDIRFSHAPITDANFSSAKKLVTNLPVVPSGTPITTSVGGVLPNDNVFVAVRAIDNMANGSTVSAFGPIKMRDAAFYDRVVNSANFTTEGAWGLTSGQSFTGTQSWADSPAGNYANSVNASLTVAAPIVPTGPMAIKFYMKSALAASDNLIVETSVNGGGWVAQASYSGTSDWASYTVPMIGMDGQSVRFRFRMSTNASGQADGVYLDDIHVVNVLTPFMDNVEGANQFSAQTPWATTTTQSFSPTRSWTDSPSGNYVNNVNSAITGLSNVGLSGIAAPTLSFYLRYALENTYDYLHVEASPNSGGVYNSLGTYTGTNTTWGRQTFSLANYDSAILRFRLTTDSSQVFDGVYVDDIVIFGEAWEEVRVIKGTIKLDAQVNTNGQWVNVAVRNPGTQTVVETGQAFVTSPGGPDGTYFYVTSKLGTYDLAFKTDKTLRRVLPSILTSSGVSDLHVFLLGGDADNDNDCDEVDLYNIVMPALNSNPSSPNWDPRADLNNDGVVNIQDGYMARRRSNLVGDN